MKLSMGKFLLLIKGKGIKDKGHKYLHKMTKSHKEQRKDGQWYYLGTD